MFKNFLLYTLPPDFKMFENLDVDVLEKHRSKPLTGRSVEKLGLAEPINDGNLYLQCEQDYVFKIEKRYKRVAKSTLQAAVAQKLSELAIEEPQKWGPQSKITKESKSALEDKIFGLLVSKTLTEFATSYLIYSPTLHLLIVEANTDNYAEDVIDLLRETFGSVKAKPIHIKKNPSQTFKSWITNDANVPEPFELLDEGLVMMSSHKSSNRVTYNSQIMNSEEISANLLANKQPQKVDLSWDNKLKFSLDDKMKFTKLRLQKSLRESINSAHEMVKDKKDNSLAEAMEKHRAKMKAKIVLIRLSLLKMLPGLLLGLGEFDDTHTRSSEAESEPESLLEGFVEE